MSDVPFLDKNNADFQLVCELNDQYRRFQAHSNLFGITEGAKYVADLAMRLEWAINEVVTKHNAGMTLEGLCIEQATVQDRGVRGPDLDLLRRILRACLRRYS